MKRIIYFTILIMSLIFTISANAVTVLGTIKYYPKHKYIEKIKPVKITRIIIINLEK